MDTKIIAKTYGIVGTLFLIAFGYAMYKSLGSNDPDWTALRRELAIEPKDDFGRANQDRRISLLLAKVGLNNCPDDIKAVYHKMYG